MVLPSSKAPAAWGVLPDPNAGGETATGNRFGSLARSQIGYSAHHAEQSNPKERQEIAAIKARGTRAGCCLFDDPDVLNV